MASLDVSDVLDDPDFRRDDLVLIRRYVEMQDDGLATGLPGAILFSGVVIPDGGKDLVQTPEGNMVSGDVTVFTRLMLSAGTGETDADLIDVDGDRYHVVNAQPYRFGSGYTRAVCKQITINQTMIDGQGSGGFLG